MAWPFDLGLRTARLRLLAAQMSRAVNAKKTAAKLRNGRLQVLAVANLTIVAAILISYAHATFGVQSTLPGASEASAASAGYPVILLVVSSAIASLALLRSSGTEPRSLTEDATVRLVEGERAFPDQSPREESADATMACLLSSMGHDLRTPLNAIIGFSDMMQQEMHGPLGSDRYQTYATHIRDSGLVLLSAIETTLALTERLSEADQMTSVPGAPRSERAT